MSEAYQLLPPLSTSEYESLKASIAEQGVLIAVEYDDNGELVDGYHRVRACRELGLPEPPKTVRHFDSDAERQAYIYMVNMARRNLSIEQKRELHRRMKAIAKVLQQEGKTQQQIAAMLGVGQSTIAKWFASIIPRNNTSEIDARIKIPPQARPLILARANTGETQEQLAADYGVNRSRIGQIINTERKAKEKREERETLVQEIGTTGIHVGDFRQLGKTIPDACVDIILTDPPYNRESIPLYGELAALASRVLRPGAWCLAYSGQKWLPDALQQMAQHLSYGWTFAIKHSGGDLRFRDLKVQNSWKPILGFYRPPLDCWWDWFPDFVSGGKEKAEHPWQQAISEAKHYINALCPTGGLVLDPMTGSGTTCLAAAVTGRRWVGFDIDPGTADTARARIFEILALKL